MGGLPIARARLPLPCHNTLKYGAKIQYAYRPEGRSDGWLSFGRGLTGLLHQFGSIWGAAPVLLSVFIVSLSLARLCESADFTGTSASIQEMVLPAVPGMPKMT